MIFNEAYYKNNLPKLDHPHFQARANWIEANHKGKRVIEPGCGFGAVIAKLRMKSIEAWGLEISQYAIDNSYAPGYILHMSDILIEKQDFVISWNFFDSIADENEAKTICSELKKADINYHILCVDDGSFDAKNYKSQGYFIKPASYWKKIFPEAVFIEYGSGIVHGAGSLKIPLSWNKISQ